jgi:hypothetical protein
LTSKLFYHGHSINRIEARDQVGIRSLEEPEPNIERLIWDLYLEYERDIQMDVPFNPLTEFIRCAPRPVPLGQWTTLPAQTARLAYIESENITDFLEIEYQLTGISTVDGKFQSNLAILNESWKRE